MNGRRANVDGTKVPGENGKEKRIGTKENVKKRKTLKDKRKNVIGKDGDKRKNNGDKWSNKKWPNTLMKESNLWFPALQNKLKKDFKRRKVHQKLSRTFKAQFTMSLAKDVK